MKNDETEPKSKRGKYFKLFTKGLSLHNIVGLLEKFKCELGFDPKGNHPKDDGGFRFE